ncbi:hypothetical protein NDU88_002771 [Pleurodeles waltl]|uniref:Uncharacterized protein n=1 Tax=Pleurodeles waltl TaxID=8319 RepID=A0AAV7SFV0_PLEWA|nr:hypothetical protein NDU88_002771 [Pleurodeles waltl]
MGNSNGRDHLKSGPSSILGFFSRFPYVRFKAAFGRSDYVTRAIAYYAEEDEYYQELPVVPYEYQMEEILVEALGDNVQDSINQALIKALKPFTQPLMRFRQQGYVNNHEGYRTESFGPMLQAQLVMAV